jgi:hypothetical protein
MPALLQVAANHGQNRVLKQTRFYYVISERNERYAPYVRPCHRCGGR